MKYLTRTAGIALTGLALVTGCGGRGEHETFRQTNTLEQVFMTSEGKVWATEMNSQHKISQRYFGKLGEFVDVYKDLPAGSKPLRIDVFYDFEDTTCFGEIHLPVDYKMSTSSERVHRGKTTVEIDNTEL
jgi:hypothetical protein